ncbi:MAG: hypothetical protein KQH59_18635 [Desulfobulbaceae bacterium]|nr:hypothetical protein [Desulfobulbaceae bacterium]
MNTAKMDFESEEFIEDLINRAHQIISETSLFEFIDLDRTTAKAKAFGMYPDLTEENIDTYLDIIEQVRSISE